MGDIPDFCLLGFSISELASHLAIMKPVVLLCSIGVNHDCALKCHRQLTFASG